MERTVLWRTVLSWRTLLSWRTNREPLPEDILGVTIQRAIKEILGDTTQRDIEEILGDTTQRDIEGDFECKFDIGLRCRMDLGGQGNLVAKLRTHGGDKDQLWMTKGVAMQGGSVGEGLGGGFLAAAC
ncbi:hypothetical protein Tco_0707992 [Tanacetum coccineum]